VGLVEQWWRLRKPLEERPAAERPAVDAAVRGRGEKSSTS